MLKRVAAFALGVMLGTSLLMLSGCPKKCPVCPSGQVCSDASIGCVPIPPPAPCPCVIPGPGAGGWAPATVETPYMRLFLAWARDEIGNACGIDPKVTMALVADKLQAHGICAVGPWTETNLSALRPDGVIEEWRVVRYDTPNYGCWDDLDFGFVKAWTNAAAKGCTKVR